MYHLRFRHIDVGEGMNALTGGSPSKRGILIVACSTELSRALQKRCSRALQKRCSVKSENQVASPTVGFASQVVDPISCLVTAGQRDSHRLSSSSRSVAN